VFPRIRGIIGHIDPPRRHHGHAAIAMELTLWAIVRGEPCSSRLKAVW